MDDYLTRALHALKALADQRDGALTLNYDQNTWTLDVLGRYADGAGSEQLVSVEDCDAVAAVRTACTDLTLAVPPPAPVSAIAAIMADTSLPPVLASALLDAIAAYKRVASGEASIVQLSHVGAAGGGSNVVVDGPEAVQVIVRRSEAGPRKPWPWPWPRPPRR